MFRAMPEVIHTNRAATAHAVTVSFPNRCPVRSRKVEFFGGDCEGVSEAQSVSVPTPGDVPLV